MTNGCFFRKFMAMNIYAYDIETFSNFFCCVFKNDTDTIRANINNIREVLLELNKRNVELVGFNNVGFDYPVLHWIIENPGCTDHRVYQYAQRLIAGERGYSGQPYFHQIDLFKIHHFDNKAKATSLKVIEFNLRMNSIQDLPYDPSITMTQFQKADILRYCEHDVNATWQFYKASIELVEFRRGLGRRWMNYSNTKIGEQWMIQELERSGIRPGMPAPVDRIELGPLLFDYIQFDRPEFKDLLARFQGRVVYETKGAITDSVTIDGFRYDFGLGGVHGSRCGVFEGDLYDWDVASYYPNLAIVNEFYPRHLGPEYCPVYRGIYEERKKHEKGTPLNAALKEALNATFGNSNNKFSPFYDPFYTMKTTVNGQLLLCMLSERLLTIDCYMIQINTDGLTVQCPPHRVKDMQRVCAEWQKLTGLVLEMATYKKMYVRDVNNYIAVGDKVKRKGAYEYNRQWHQNHSALIVPRAVEAHLLHGVNVEQFIREWKDPFDFMLRTKVRRSDQLFWGDDPVQRVTRYYVSTNGRELSKVIPAKGIIGHYKRARGMNHHEWDDTVWIPSLHTKNKSTWQDTCTAVEAGRLITIANNFNGMLDNVDYQYYIEKAYKLIEVFTDE